MIATQSQPQVAQPVAPFDPDRPRCRNHRSTPGGPVVDLCADCEQARDWVASRRAEQERQRARECPMCDSTGQRWDPVLHTAVVPYRSCDHSTPHEVVVAELAEAERAREAALARPRPVVPVPSSEAGRRRARALFRPSRPALPAPSGRPVGDVAARERARAELASAAAGPAGSPKGGLDGAPVEQVADQDARVTV